AIVIDEAHCLANWGDFCPEYRELGRLRFVLPGVTLLVVSATLTKHALSNVMGHLRMHVGKTIVLLC
ncbi:hypothetical protein EV363DRAFT_1117908, partial [Boletus edulis]